MLIKEVCQSCINNMDGVSIGKEGMKWVAYEYGSKDEPICFQGWHKKDEENWKNDIVKCRVVPSASSNIQGTPPHWCECIAEHLICGG